MSKFVKIFLRKALSSFDRIYTYKVPETMLEDISIGRRVLIPFGKGDRFNEAFIFSILNLKESSEAEKLGDKIKSLAAVLDKGPLLSNMQIKLLAQMKQLYSCTYGQAASLMLPAGFNLQLAEIITITDLGLDELDDTFIEIALEISKKKNKFELSKFKFNLDDFLLKSYKRNDLISLAKDGLININLSSDQKIKRKSNEHVKLINREEAISLFEDSALGSIQQDSIIEYLISFETASTQEIIQNCNVKRNSLKTLESKGLIEFFHKEISTDDIEVDSFDPELLPKNFNVVSDNDLSQEQINAIASINSSINNRLNKEFLLYGITGSGKTEVYIRAVRNCLSKGQKAILLVPEIGLTPQMVGQFNLHFPEKITVLHSGLSQRERFDSWEKIKAGDFEIVIGARSAIFSPLDNLGLIIIDEEQESSYASDMSPYYDARTIARLRSLNENVTLVLGSATPSLETFYRSLDGKAERLELSARAGMADLPPVEIIDLRQDWNTDTEGIISNHLFEAMQKTLNREEQVMLFLNRRGFASTVLCSECGQNIECPNCSITFTYHRDKNLLICHYCGTTEKLSKICKHCGEESIINYGFGTQKLEAICRKLFPEVDIFRIDQDTSTNSKKQAALFQKFRESKSSILIGTQMIAKGHNFPRLTLVGILNVDQMISRNDYQAAEHAFQLITQAAGRAGRADLPGKVYIQAFDVDNYAIQASSRHNYKEFVEQELNFRKALKYPPFSTLAHITISSENKNLTAQASRELYDIIEKTIIDNNLNDLIVLKPAPANLYKLQNRWRWNIIIKSNGEDQIKKLSSLWHKISLMKNNDLIRVSFRLDPA
ncbi:replication restart helicase PriA [Fastidiosipila sanguinis]|uniref:Replication restart protein PriA n=1 Tax=Fastidiosipila sanguinis TaxID=236753 RepID=A0A2S0KMD8_9FIRM|nr:primosomal protein N' [Fastidiosipila sanguinis]AVM42177.1 primosomal protein N' [Fastidiosipila sanguinis]